MAARITIERLLRDDDDASGQTIRNWQIEAEPGFVKVCLKHGDGFLLMRADDVDLFVADMERAEAASRSLTSEGDGQMPRDVG